MATNRLVEKQEVATYASLLLSAAQGEGGRDKVLAIRSELEAVAAAVRGQSEVVEVLTDSAYAPEQRNATARKLFAMCDPILVDVLAVMAERGDISKLSRITASFEDQLRTELNLNVVEVTTAVPLDDDLRAKITAKLAADLGTDVVLDERVDASILGGIIMSANGRRIDASVTSQLDHARNVLTQNTDGGER